MNILFIIFDEFRFMGQLLSAGLMLALPSLKRRSGFALRSILGAVLCLAFTLMFFAVGQIRSTVNEETFTIFIQIAWYSLLVILFACYLAFCFKINLSEILWLVILSYAMQHIVYVLTKQLLFKGLLTGISQNFPAYAGITVAVWAALYFIFYKIFGRNIKGRDHLPLIDNIKTRITYALFVLMFIASTFLNQYEAEHVALKLNYNSAIIDLFNCIFVLVIQYSTLRMWTFYVEKADAVKMYNNETKQYESFKKSVDYVNIKCHDIKHQIKQLQQEGLLSPEKIKELNESVEIYESFASTGNKTLDMVLSGKYLDCRTGEIAFSYMADAERLNMMEASDIYALFSNMLDNAIEYVKTIEDKHKRYIRLSVKPMGNMLHVHQENYFEGELEFVEGLPQTTKSDKIYHGFGVKSMQMIAKKYDGRLRVDVAGGIFRIDILFSKKTE